MREDVTSDESNERLLAFARDVRRRLSCVRTNALDENFRVDAIASSRDGEKAWSTDRIWAALTDLPE